jgi:hypothetical protein
MAVNNFPYGVLSPALIPDIADRALDEYMAITAGLGIRSAVTLGTCLGFVRDREYLKGDNDIDVCAIVTAEERAFLTYRLIQAGFLMGRTYPSNNTHFVKDEILLDVFWRKAEGFYSEFGQAEHGGKQYPVPARIDEYLTACYGDWRTDNPDHPGSVYEG